MAQPYVTGPCHIYVGISSNPPRNPFNPSGSPVYLGTCRAAPRIQWDPAFEPVINDISGPRKPFDMIYLGKDAMISGDLTVWNWPVWEQIKSLPNTALPSGAQEQGDIGSLMVLEGYSYPIWIHYPFHSKAAMRDAGMVAGHRFAAGWLMGPIAEDPGNKSNSAHVQFYAINAYDKATGKFLCSDNNMTGIPTIPPQSPLGI